MSTALDTSTLENWTPLCTVDELVADSGVAARLREQQIALFYLPSERPAVYAIDNWDPFGKANVLSRGIVGDLGGELVVASPLYKQHFSLLTGRCSEHPEVTVRTHPVRLVDERVEVGLQEAARLWQTHACERR